MKIPAYAQDGHLYNRDDIRKWIGEKYSSPMTRCIQTSVVLQDYIREKTGHLPLIRIEYALREIYTVSELNYVNANKKWAELDE